MSADSIDLIAQEQFSDEVRETYQQTDRKFEGMTATFDLSTGDLVNTPIIGPADDPLERGGRHGAIVDTSGDFDNLQIPRSVFRGRWNIDSEDVWLTRADVRGAQAREQVKAGNRLMDKRFMSAAVLGASDIGSQVAPLTKATVDAMREYADTAEWPDEERFVAIDPIGFTQLTNMAVGAGGYQIFTSRDFTDQMPLVRPRKVFDYAGFHWVQSNRVIDAGSYRQGLMWTKSGIGFATTRTPNTKLFHDPDDEIWKGTYEVAFGYKTLQAAGVRLVTYLG